MFLTRTDKTHSISGQTNYNAMWLFNIPPSLISPPSLQASLHLRQSCLHPLVPACSLQFSITRPSTKSPSIFALDLPYHVLNVYLTLVWLKVSWTQKPLHNIFAYTHSSAASLTTQSLQLIAPRGLTRWKQYNLAKL